MEKRLGALFKRAQKLEDSDFHGWLCHSFGALSTSASESAYRVILRNLEDLEREASLKPKDEEEET